MKAAAPPILPLFRSVDQMRLLALMFLHPDEAHPISKWADLAGLTFPTASREMRRAADAGIVTVSRVGTSKLTSANVESPFFEPLTQLLVGTYGASTLLADALDGVTGIADAYLFGSWASRISGEAGSAPNDIDLLVVGEDVDRDAVYDAVERLEDRLPVPVQVVFRTPAEWDDLSDPFIKTVRSRPLIRLDLLTSSRRESKQ